jgi:tetratricopeptide (TPR) repeat protein/KaiC/GvpD/RAD55 family RecA-like ATPase
LKSGILAEPVLVGRERELGALQHYLELAVEGKGLAVFISGEGGAGKTRLTREFLNAAKKKGIAVMAGWCLSDAQVPYFPFIEAFNAYFASFPEEEQPVSPQQTGIQLGLGAPQVGSEEREITAWLTGPRPAEKLGRPEALSPQVWKDQAFAAVAKTLHSISVKEPLILFIEDIHWADSASLALLRYVARAINDSERVLILATFRTEELTADAEGHPHPLTEALRMMRREDLFIEIKLQNLGQADVSKIAENMMGGSLQTGFAEKLARESRGNPLFIVESLRMLHERSGLIKEGDQWRLSADTLGIPPKIKDIILQRLGVLGRNEKRVLDAASVIGEKFNVELLASVLGLDYLGVIETLDEIGQTTSLVCCEGELYRFDHVSSRDTIYEEISPALKRGFHAKVAEKLEAVNKGGKLPLSEVAYHYAQAGNKEKAVEYALAAGQGALARCSNSQAIQHFAYALQNVPEGHAEEKRTALEGLGDAYTANYRFGEAIRTFDELAAQETGAVRLRALRKAMDAAYLKGDKPDLLLEYARKAEELAVNDRLEMARVLNSRGRAFGWAGRGDPRVDLADYDAALQVFEEENSLADAAEALWRSGQASTRFEDLREKGLGELLRSVAIFRELGDVRKEIEATLWVGQGLWWSGLLPEARREYANILRTSEKLDVFAESAEACIHLSVLYEADGKLAEAVSQSLKALEYCKKTDAYWIQGHAYAYLARQYSKLGDFKHADEYLDRITRLSPEVLSQLHVALVAALARGVYFAAKAQWDESNQCFKKLLESLKTKYTFPSVEALVRANHAWALERQGRAEEARVQLDSIQKLLEKAEERFGHANVQLNVMMPRKVQVEEEFEMRLDLVNVGRKPGVLAKIEGAIPSEFKVANLPSFCSLQNGSLNMKDKSVDPFQVETIKLKLEATKTGNYSLNPEVTYLDDLGKTKAFKPNPIIIAAQPAKPAYETLPGRITTGFTEVDRLLFGGIPENYGVVLISPSSDEREMLINRFLKAGAEAGQTTFYVTAEAGSARALAEKHQSNFYLFLCNPRVDAMVQSLPNVFKLEGVESLTGIDIALTKSFRTLSPLAVGPKRACIEIVSDALLEHHALITRKWLSALLPDLKSKGFTTLAVVNPQMHPQEEVQSILGLFEGEIRISEKETAKGTEKVLKIRKLYNQRYLENELTLTKESLEA